MSGISSGAGIFSGIDSASIIDKLISIERRPKILAQRRILQLQQQQGSYLGQNAKLAALKTASAAFRLNKIFESAAASTSDDKTLTATATAGTPPGQYQFIVDQLVSTQQRLSQGFSSNSVGMNAGTFSFESNAARLDRDTALADLNGGTGITRGKVVVTDAANRTATIDLSRAATVGDVLKAFNDATGVRLDARVEGGKFVIKTKDGSNFTIVNEGTASVAESLGILQSTPAATVTGSQVYKLAASTAVAALNDGNGVFINSGGGSARSDFRIIVGSTTVNVNIGAKFNDAGTQIEAAPTTLGGVLQRINTALAEALGDDGMKAEIAPDGVSLRIVDANNRTFRVQERDTTGTATTARDLGLLTGDVTGSFTGKRILAGMNSTLASSLKGGRGLSGNGAISVTARDGSTFTVNVDTSGSITDILAAFSRDTGGKVTASLNKNGTGISLRDTTAGTGALIVQGDTATSLGVATPVAGVNAASVDGSNLQRQYITAGTTLASLRNGAGIGTGTFRTIDSTGAVADITVGESVKTLDDLMQAINSRGNRVKAKINDNGDGLVLYESATGGGTLKMRVEDSSGSVAANLNIKGEAAGTGAQNTIDGSFEKKLTFAASDSLQQIVTKINSANVGVTAALLNDGSGTSPWRLSLTARASGTAGRTIVDTGSFDLGLSTIDQGRDARVFFGSSDPATALLLTGSRNTLDKVVPGLSVDLKATSATPVTVTVARDTQKIQDTVGVFVSAYNALIAEIADDTKYNPDTKVKGPLLGDSTSLGLRSQLAALVNEPARNVTGRYRRLSDVGITAGAGGTLKVDNDKLRQALETDPQAVAALFATREVQAAAPQQVAPGITANNPNAATVYTAEGVMTRFENLADSYTNSVDGRLTRRGKTLQDQIDAQNKRISDLDVRLAARRAILENQFQQMESAIGKLQTQSASIGQIGG